MVVQLVVEGWRGDDEEVAGLAEGLRASDDESNRFWDATAAKLGWEAQLGMDGLFGSARRARCSRDQRTGSHDDTRSKLRIADCRLRGERGCGRATTVAVWQSGRGTLAGGMGQPHARCSTALSTVAL
jgi:hypothetical protein